MAQIIDGNAVAKSIRKSVRVRIAEYEAKYGTRPGLTVILVGNDPASRIYVNNKKKACEKVGIIGETIELPEDTSQDYLLSVIDRLNQDPSVNGILVQLPLPGQIDPSVILSAILPSKDVDGFHPVNAGKMLQGKTTLEPCTPKGCMELLHSCNAKLDGAEAVVIGRSNLVGKPMALMLQREGCTVTVCHSHTKDLKSHLQNADIVVCAAGKPRLVRGDMLKQGCIVLDVGINRLADGSLCGDVDFDSACEKAAFITPVPGGVGPMTIAELLVNTLAAAEEFHD